MPDINIYAVAGKPIMHSRSPIMFNAAFRALSVGAVYTRFAATDAQEIAECMREIGIAGMNITSPFKEEIINHLEWVEEKAGLIGAINTVVNRNGQLHGFNTDWIGAKNTFVRNGIPLSGKKSIVIGAGGAARAAAFALITEGSDVVVCNRTPDKAEKIAHDMGCRASSLASIDEEMKDADILVSCLPEVSSQIVAPSLLREKLVVVDANYGAETMLLRDARTKGCTIIDGREWLLFQGGAAFTHFTGIKPPLYLMKELLYRHVENGKKNLALIGFMTSGKTTLAQVLGQRLGCSVIDIDSDIEHAVGCTVSELFAKRGEHVFRDFEKKSISKIRKLSDTVIACGGGAILDEVNRTVLKRNCHVIWLWDDLKSIMARAENEDGRPLLRGSNGESIDAMLKSRLPLYALTSDMIIRTDNRAATEVAERIGYENHFTFSH
jgi:shikimate dehydrogenase